MVDYTPTEKETLVDMLLRGDNLPAGIGECIDRHPKSVGRALSALKERGLADEKNDYHVWTLTAGGREEAMRLSRETETLRIESYEYIPGSDEDQNTNTSE